MSQLQQMGFNPYPDAGEELVARRRLEREKKIDAKVAEFNMICVRYGKSNDRFPTLVGEEFANCQTELRCLLPAGKYRNSVGILVYVKSVDFLPGRDRVIDCVVTYVVDETRIEHGLDVGSFIAAHGFLHEPDAASL